MGPHKGSTLASTLGPRKAFELRTSDLVLTSFPLQRAYERGSKDGRPCKCPRHLWFFLHNVRLSSAEPPTYFLLYLDHTYHSSRITVNEQQLHGCIFQQQHYHGSSLLPSNTVNIGGGRSRRASLWHTTYQSKTTEEQHLRQITPLRYTSSQHHYTVSKQDIHRIDSQHTPASTSLLIIPATQQIISDHDEFTNLNTTPDNAGSTPPLPEAAAC